MTVKVDGTEPNIFPAVDYLDARDAGRNAEVIFGAKITNLPCHRKLSCEQANALAALLEPFRANTRQSCE
jgi:hypothetical protein